MGTGSGDLSVTKAPMRSAEENSEKGSSDTQGMVGPANRLPDLQILMSFDGGAQARGSRGGA